MKQEKFGILSKTTLLSSAALMLMGMPAVAFAQTAGEAAAEDEDVIVVTARKRSEDIQTVPISITALTAAELADRNISNLSDLSNSTPGLAITSISGGTLVNIYLRGLAPANTTNDLNVESNVGVFIDGIYQTSRNTLDIISVLDVGQIEVAKGPQSALFGRSTFAGALSVSTAKPSDVLEGSLSATVGQDEDYRVRGSVSIPLTESLSARFAGGYVTYDGYAKNLSSPGDKSGGTEKYAFTGSLAFEPSDSFKAVLSGFVTHSETEASPQTQTPFGDFNCGNFSGATNTFLLYCGELETAKTTNLTAGIPDSIGKTRQIALDLEWRKGGVLVTSTTGYTEAESRAYNDYGGSNTGVLFGVCTPGIPAATFCSPFAGNNYNRLTRVNLISVALERVRTFSQEIRLQSDNDSPFSWLIGGSYFDSQIPVSAGGIGASAPGLLATERLIQVPQFPPAATPVPASGFGFYDFTGNLFLVPNATTSQVFSQYTDASTKTMGIFGALGYRFGDLRINVEGRYNSDRKRSQSFLAPNPGFQPGFYQPIDGTNTPTAGFTVPGTVFAKTFNSFTPRVTIDYQATPDIFLYASAAKGVRSGGFNTFNPVSPTGILADEVAYDEETNWTYEAGFKARLLDRALLLNASVFYTDWTNVQTSAFTNNPTAINPSRIVQNIGDIKSTGFEAQMEYSFPQYFSFGGSVTYSNPEFQSGAYDGGSITQCRTGATPATYGSAPGCPPIIAVPTANGGTQYVPSIDGLRNPRSVKWQWNAHAGVDVPLSDDWRLTGRVDVNYSGASPYNLLNTGYFGERTLTNLRFGIQSDSYSLSFWANNVFDVHYVVNSIIQPRAGNSNALSVPENYLGEGRRMGITGTVKF